MNAVRPTGHCPGISDRDFALVVADLNAATAADKARERRLTAARRMLAAERAGLVTLAAGEPAYTPRGRYFVRMLGHDFPKLLAGLPA